MEVDFKSELKEMILTRAYKDVYVKVAIDMLVNKYMSEFDKNGNFYLWKLNLIECHFMELMFYITEVHFKRFDDMQELLIKKELNRPPMNTDDLYAAIKKENR